MKPSNLFKLNAIVLASLMLAACGGGGDSNASSASNTQPGNAGTGSGGDNTGSNASGLQPESAYAATDQGAQKLSWSLDTGVTATQAQINVGTAIGAGAGGTPFTLAQLAKDPNNTQTILSDVNPFNSTGHVPDTAYGLCDYSATPPTRIDYSTTSKFVSPPSDPMVPMAPFYFPLVYTSLNTPTPNTGTGTATPVIGLFDWRPKDIDEALVAAESDDNGKTWYFMQTVLELDPGNSACPAKVTGTNAGTTADNGWGHASIVQLPGAGGYKTGGQMLYMLNRDPAHIDVDPLYVIQLNNSSNKFPIYNTNTTATGGQDIRSIATALASTTQSGSATAPLLKVQQTNGLLHPDGIMAVVPNTDPTQPTKVLYVEKILNGDTAMPSANRCTNAPFSGKTNDDISNVRLAETTDGINFTDLGIVKGLNDPYTVDYNKTRWISPRGTLIDINGDGSRWGLLFGGGNCLDGDSDAFHYIGYAESTDLVNWTVYNDINSPIASINNITTKNQSGGSSVTIPANSPKLATQPWFAQRLYAPTAIQIDATHLSMTFAGYGVQSPNDDLLNYRAIGNVVLTANQPLPIAPNNVNMQ